LNRAAAKTLMGRSPPGAVRLIGLTLIALVVSDPAVMAAETLPHALAEAYETNPSLRAARHALDITNEARPQALGNWLPTVSLGGGATRELTSGPRGYRNRADTFDGQAQVALPITHGGGEFAALRQADHQILAGRAQLLATEQTVLNDAAKAFMDLLTANLIVGYRAENVAALTRTVATLIRQMKAGDRTLTEVTLARSNLEAARGLLIQAQGVRDQSRATYQQIIGVPAAELAMPKPLTVLPHDLTEAAALAEQANPAVVAAINQWHAAEDGVEVQGAQLLPSLAFIATRQVAASFMRPPNVIGPDGITRNTTFGVQLTIPLYQAGQEYSALRTAKKTVAQRQDEVQVARTGASALATQAWSQRSTAEATLAILETRLAENRSLVEQYRTLLEAGLVTILEVVTGYQGLVNAEIDFATARHDRILADFAVLGSVGGLTARTLGLAVQYYDEKGDYRRVKWGVFGLAID